MAVSPAEFALRVDDVGVEPDVRVGQPVAPCPGLPEQGEGLPGLPVRLDDQRETPGGDALPARVTELTGSGEGRGQVVVSAGAVAAGQS